MKRQGLTERLQPVFEENFAHRGEVGAACAVWDADEGPLFDQYGGHRDRQGTPWDAETLVLVWSTTKGAASAACLHALIQHEVALTETVAHVWPEFGAAGKSEITFSELLSHRAGLPILERAIEAFDRDEIESALAAQTPLDTSEFAQTYHAKTYGYLLDAVIRRLTGADVGTYWRQAIAEPAELDLWIGLPESKHHRVAPIYAARSLEGAESDAFYQKLADTHSFTRRAFASPTGLPTPSSMNRPEARQAVLASLGGIGSARALAKFYALLATNRAPFQWPLEAWEAVSKIVTQGPDGVLAHEVAFSTGFMKDPVLQGRKKRELFGPSLRAFGQPGAGGSHAFGDPHARIGFGYVMNQMEPGVLPGPKALSLVEALYAGE